YVVGRSLPELGGSLWARLGESAGLAVPAPNPRLTRRLGEKLLALGAAGRLRSVHDVSDGGLAVTLAEMAFGGSLGFEVDLAATLLEAPAQALAVEGGSRWVVEVPPAWTDAFEASFRGLPTARLGEVTEGDGVLRWQGETVGRVDLQRLYSPWRAGLGVP
ncbi:MAG TPA: AIR synthase-related protein, partial [Thermoplasmata archaeon]